LDNNAGTRLSLGDDEPLTTGGRNNPPDRREISARWLTGTVLTGVTSTVLLGVALSAALDGREQLATPPETALLADVARDADGAHRTARLNPSPVLGGADTRRQMEVSTIHKDGDREVVRSLPFVHLRVPLAVNYSSAVEYPPFDPLTVFAEESVTSNLGNMGVIYGAKVESEMALRTLPFPLEEAVFDEGSELSAEEVEQVVRDTSSILSEGNIQVASLHYVDPQRFGETLATQTLGTLGVRIVPENVSTAPRNSADSGSRSYAEDIILLTGSKPIVKALSDAGYDGPDATGMAEAISKLLNTDTLKGGAALCLGVEIQDERPHIMRASLFEKKEHMLTIALNDRGQYVPSEEPELSDELMAALANEPRTVASRADLPRVYDGVFSAALSHGLNRDMTRKLIRLLAADVDMQSRLAPTDKIEVFFSQPAPNGNATESSELLYVSAVFDSKERTFYRFQLPDGTVDYFDSEGRSSRPFLIRNPVPAGRMTSPFGMRRHPILGYSKMHTGVDWAAPRGTPIMATGDGVVESAGWSAGYGRQTIVRHANGYKTSYNHQSGIAEGVKKGATVRQGQVIGFVGATGLATGNHLHYEMFVNGSRVDPMRVRLPNSRSLEGEVLEAFKSERERIEALLEDSFSRPVVAAATN
jgi:murein DD-endopeptidase MepM/ murein hydrolase activator NlpD